MSLLKSIALLFVLFGLVAFVFNGDHGAWLLKVGVVLAVVCVVVDYLLGRRTL